MATIQQEQWSVRSALQMLLPFRVAAPVAMPETEEDRTDAARSPRTTTTTPTTVKDLTDQMEVGFINRTQGPYHVQGHVATLIVEDIPILRVITGREGRPGLVVLNISITGSRRRLVLGHGNMSAPVTTMTCQTMCLFTRISLTSLAIQAEILFVA